jgi:hypothetical protein
MQMIRMAIFVAVITAFSGLMTVYVYAGGPAAATLGKPSSLSNLVGAHVYNPKEEFLGRVSDFVIDPQGHVTFVILANGGFLGFGERKVAVPFGSFAYDRERKHFILDLANGPKRITGISVRRPTGPKASSWKRESIPPRSLQNPWAALFPFIPIPPNGGLWMEAQKKRKAYPVYSCAEPRGRLPRFEE